MKFLFWTLLILPFCIKAQTVKVDTMKVYDSREIEERAAPLDGFSDYMRMYVRNVGNTEPDRSIEYATCWRRVEFIVEKNGELTFQACTQCKASDYINEIKEIFSSPLCPKWKPATIQGQAVRQKASWGFSCIKYQ